MSSNTFAPMIQIHSLVAGINETNAMIDALEADPEAYEHERHKEYYVGSHNSGSALKNQALILSAQVDDHSPEYKTLILPLIARIDQFFARPSHDLDFIDEVRMLRAKNLIESGAYQQADQVYRNIFYGPLYAQAFEQRNKYFLTAAKNHLHLFKKLTLGTHAKYQLICTLQALQYACEYPYGDDIVLYKNPHAVFAQNYYVEAKMLVLKVCNEWLGHYLKQMNASELLTVYKTLLPYKYALILDMPEVASAQQFNHRVQRWQAMSRWHLLVEMLQHYFIYTLFPHQQFHAPDRSLINDTHLLLDEPTSTLEELRHFVGKTALEKHFLAALEGNESAARKLLEKCTKLSLS